MINENSYYERMSSTMNDKCKTLYPRLYDGVKVLDFGAGKDLSIAKLVESFNGKYISVDNSPQVQEFFEENGIQCYSSINDINESFDIIFLSSVFHELLSYLSPLEVAAITSKFSKLIGENGIIVMRDWNVLNANEWHQLDEIIFNKEKLEEIKKWICVLKERGIIENNDVLEITNDSIKGCRNDLYNILYHTTWGLASIPRESKENYVILYENILRYFYNNNLELKEKLTTWDESYIDYIGKYFKDYGERVKNQEQWVSPKVKLVLQRKKTSVYEVNHK